MRSLLAARGITVVTTRESDAVVDADHRAEVANRANAQACLTLHASQSGTGVHIYASSLAPAEPATMLPWKTAQAAWVTRSLALAGVLNSSLSHAGLNVALGRTDLPTINSMACPALAIEIGKSSSPDATQSGGFDDADYQARIAQATRRRNSRMEIERLAYQHRIRGGRQTVIPRYQTVLFVILLVVSIIMGAVLWQLRNRAHERMLAGQDSAPTQAPQVAPTEQATLMVANDQENSLMTQVLSLPLPPSPNARAQVILGKLLELYALPNAAHAVPGGAAGITQVFLLPVPSDSASNYRRTMPLPKKRNRASSSPSSISPAHLRPAIHRDLRPKP